MSYDAQLQKQIKELTIYDDPKLRELLADHGLGDLPFSISTKGLLIRKLARKLIGPEETPRLGQPF